jgi:DNA-binding beta-propeller fold protein YncE
MRRTSIHLVLMTVGMMTMMMVMPSCVPRENVINPPESDWQLLALSPERPSRLAIFNQPSNTVADNNAFSVLGANGIGGRVSKIVTFRENIYVLLPDERKIEVLSSATYRRVATLDFSASGRVPADIAFANATTGYIAFSEGSNVGVLDITVFRVVADINVGQWPVDLETQGNVIYCALQRENAIAIIDSRSNSVTARIPVPPAPTFMGVSVNGRTLVVVSAGGGKFDNSPRSAGRVAFVDIVSRSIRSQAVLTNTADSTSDVPRGFAITELDFAFVPMNSTLLRLDTRNFVRSTIANNVKYRNVSYNPIRGELLLTSVDSTGASCLVADPQTAEAKSTIKLPFQATYVMSR